MAAYETSEGRRERYDRQKIQSGERRVSARFDPETLRMVDALAARHGSVAEALRVAVRKEYARAAARRGDRAQTRF